MCFSSDPITDQVDIGFCIEMWGIAGDNTPLCKWLNFGILIYVAFDIGVNTHPGITINVDFDNSYIDRGPKNQSHTHAGFHDNKLKIFVYGRVL